MGALRLEGLSLRYPGRATAAVHDLDLDVADGEFVALVGPSGCGKSTTLRLIAGFLRPDAGRILVDGLVLSDPHTVIPPERRNMGMVFQGFAVWPHLTVFENVAFGLRMRRLAEAQLRQRVTDMLAQVDLPGYERSYPSQLSGGQQQRVALARALVVEPGTLLLDEPLSSLDAQLRDRMCAELKDLQRRTGVTFIHVTHDQGEAIAVADRVAVMHGGRIVQYDTARDVYLRPATRVVADAMGSVNLIEADVVHAGSDTAEVRLLAASHIVLHVATRGPRAGRVTVAIRPEDIAIARGGNGLAGVVASSTFRGAFAEHVVNVGGEGAGPPLALRVHTLGRELHDASTHVKLTLDGGLATIVD